MAVVGHHHQGTGIVLQGQGQRRAHFQIEVIGGFIEQQQIGRLPDQQGEHQARLFATRQRRHRAACPIAGETETAEKVAPPLLGGNRTESGEVFEGAGAGIELLQLVLREITDTKIGTGFARSGQRQQFARERTYQGRFAGPIGSQQADAIARRELQPDAVEDRRIAVPHSRFVQHQQRVAGARRLLEAEAEGIVDLGGSHQRHSFQRLDPALRGAGLGGLRAEAVDEALHMGHGALLLFVGRLLPRQTRRALVLEIAVATPVLMQLPVLDVQHLINHGVEKIAVVRDQQQGAAIGLQPVFQPQHRFEIEVIGRFVEQQQVGRTHQCPGETEAHAPAAGKRGGRSLLIGGAKAEPGQQCRRTGVGGVAVHLLIVGVGAADGGAVAIGVGTQDLALGVPKSRIAVEHQVEGRSLQVAEILRHMSDDPVFRDGGLAGLGRQFAAQQRQQRAFAAAIGADQADAMARVERRRSLLQQGLDMPAQGNAGELDHGFWVPGRRLSCSSFNVWRGAWGSRLRRSGQVRNSGTATGSASGGPGSKKTGTGHP